MVVHGRDSNWLAFFQMPRLAIPFEVKLVAELGKVRSHIAGILDRCDRCDSSNESEKKSCQLHFFKYRCILVENKKKT